MRKDLLCKQIVINPTYSHINPTLSNYFPLESHLLTYIHINPTFTTYFATYYLQYVAKYVGKVSKWKSSNF